MAVRKEMIVLNGSGHKGVVKISGIPGRDDCARINCSLDFRPSGAVLYLIGEKIAKITLKDVNTDVEVPFVATDDIGCVLRSSSLTMFGGRRIKSEMLNRIEAYNREQSQANAEKCASVRRKSEHDVSEQKTAPKQDHGNVSDEAVVLTNAADEYKNSGSGGILNKTDVERDDDINPVEEKTFVGASIKTDVNPLGEWTKYDGNNFYYAIKPQIDEMFICYPEEKLLGNTVPNSKWVRVDAEDGYYVVGLLFDESEPAYICYGVPQYPTGDKNSRRAPAELENMCVWLPVADGAEMDGYWMIYQSARTGEIIK